VDALSTSDVGPTRRRSRMKILAIVFILVGHVPEVATALREGFRIA
jgi:hypothetical protein